VDDSRDIVTTLSALREECEAVSEVVLALPEGAFGRPTRCADWNVKELLAHMLRDMRRLVMGLEDPAPPKATHDDLGYWRQHEEAASAPRISARTTRFAAEFPKGTDIARAWDETWHQAVATAEHAAPGRIVSTWGPAMELDQYLRTRVLEILVHRMDLEDALGKDFEPADEAVSIVEETLAGLLGEEPPADLGWGGVEFIEAACGRRGLTEEERRILGSEATERLPLVV